MRFRLSILLALLAAFILVSTTAIAETVKGPVATGNLKYGGYAPMERSSAPGNLPRVGSRNPTTLDEVIISEDFEDEVYGTIPSGWLMVDGDEGTNSDPFPLGPSVWRVFGGNGTNWPAHSGTDFICCAYNNPPIPNDDWLIIPVGALEAPITFSYWRATHQVAYPESYELRLSTTGSEPADFTVLLLDENNISSNTYLQQTIDLSAYAGAPFYLAFHHNSIDMFLFKVDDVLLEAAGAGPTGTIEGTVTDAETTTPLAGVLVGASTASATTVANGTYTLNDVPVGTHTVSFVKEGYEPTSVTGVVVTADQTTTVNAQMTETFVPPTIENDDCDDPFVLEGVGDFEFSTLNATVDPTIAVLDSEACYEGYPLTFAADIWIAWNAPGTGTASFSTCDQATYDTRMACYTAETVGCPPCPTNNDNFHACNDDGEGCTGWTSILEFDVQSGHCYLVRIGGYGTFTGSGTVTVSFEGPPAPAIAVSTDELDFGQVAVGVPSILTFTVNNTAGTANLQVTSITCPTGYTATPGAFAIPAGSTTARTITVTLTAPGEGVFEGDLVINSNDPTTPTLVHVIGGTEAANENPGLADDYYVATSYPNPFNPETTISFAIPKAENVVLTVYNSIGQAVATLNNGRLDAGRHSFTFSGADLPSGLYFARITSDGFSQTLKTVLLK